MDWLTLALTFALGLSISAALLFWRQTTRRHGEQVPTQSVAEEDANVENRNMTADAAAQAQNFAQFGFENPRRAFMDAFRRGDTESAIALLPALEDLLGRDHPEFLLSAGALASAGKKEGLPFLLSAIQSEQEFDEHVLQSLIACVVQYYVSTDREKEGLDEIGEFVRRCADDRSMSNEVRAYIANQLQMLYFGSNRLEEALRTIENVIAIAPNDASYYFNRSLVLEGLGRLNEAVRDIEKCLSLDASDDKDHLYRAANLYAKTGDLVKMKSLGEKLKKPS